MPISEGDEIFDAYEVEDFRLAWLVEADDDVCWNINKEVTVVWLSVCGHIAELLVFTDGTIYITETPFLMRCEPCERKPAGLGYFQLVDLGA